MSDSLIDVKNLPLQIEKMESVRVYVYHPKTKEYIASYLAKKIGDNVYVYSPENTTLIDADIYTPVINYNYYTTIFDKKKKKWKVVQDHRKYHYNAIDEFGLEYEKSLNSDIFNIGYYLPEEGDTPDSEKRYKDECDFSLPEEGAEYELPSLDSLKEEIASEEERKFFKFIHTLICEFLHVEDISYKDNKYNPHYSLSDYVENTTISQFGVVNRRDFYYQLFNSAMNESTRTNRYYNGYLDAVERLYYSNPSYKDDEKFINFVESVRRAYNSAITHHMMLKGELMRCNDYKHWWKYRKYELPNIYKSDIMDLIKKFSDSVKR